MYDVIVVGGGHAGCEAAAAAARSGSNVLLISMNLHLLGAMSCNPAMGGIGKGQIIREIDALGGLSGIISDASLIQFRMLNKSKGPGMWSPRTQNDRQLFSQYWREELEKISNISFWQDTVISLVVSRGTAQGVKTLMGQLIMSRSVILTNGTFLNGRIHVGRKQFSGGRIGEKHSIGLTEQLEELGFTSGRLKTGTPPRIDGRSLNYKKMEIQKGDEDIIGFSFLETKKPAIQKNCWITHTNEAVHRELKKGFSESPVYCGDIKGGGPRYCPSIEDKISRFAGKDAHQLFIEPEGWNNIEVYVNGFSTSLPADIQFTALRKVNGFENCKFFRPGYSIEYDYFQPTQLKSTLETKLISNLFFAGQINGTTGYEEAACQGLIAGINASNCVSGRDKLILGRDEAYIGVLIDDLINKGTDEPYRMFTSRAEYRTTLRQDNADLRLTRKGEEFGLVSNERLQNVIKREASILSITKILDEIKLEPEEINICLLNNNSTEISEKTALSRLLLRPNINIDSIMDANKNVASVLGSYKKVDLQQVEIQLKYSSYIQKEKDLATKMKSLEEHIIPVNFDYTSITALSIEAKQKLDKIRPLTLGQAGRISGVNPTDIQIVMTNIGR